MIYVSIAEFGEVPNVNFILNLGDSRAASRQLAGGKAASLARLARAGFAVPPAFVVTTEAYRTFIATNELAARIDQLVEQIDFADPAALETAAAQVRDLILTAPVSSDLTSMIAAAYAELDEPEPVVAVRSSGTAEDLAEASFAGQHDTYLGILGSAAVVDAVRRCWASLWTARAIAYRRRLGFDHAAVSLCVVVQTMVESEVSGVMFTANPLTGATDEIVVDASWGLGEGIVSGILTPDHYVIAATDRSVKARDLGSKEVEIVRAPGGGTSHRTVGPARAGVLCLTDDQLAELVDLGLRVQDHYEGLPQDIEWAFAGGNCYLLQSRDITGVDFDWDDGCERWRGQLQPRPDDDTVWTRAWADAVWPGAITPLYFSIRAEMFTRIHLALAELWGWEHVGKLQMFKYHKGVAYFNARIEYLNLAHALPPALRVPELLPHMPKAWHREILDEPGSWLNPVKLLARLRMIDPDHGPYRAFSNLYNGWMRDRRQDAAGLEPSDIRRLSDAELRQYLLDRNAVMKEWGEDLWTLLWIQLPTISGIFTEMIRRWYDGEDSEWIFNDLITGLPNGSVTLTENLMLWKFAQDIQNSAELLALFTRHPGAEFFDHLDECPDGQRFHVRYREFLEDFGHRGHSDRDMHAKRRIEDPGIDYINFDTIIKSGAGSPEITARTLIERRESAAARMIRSIRRQPFGALKVEAFTLVNDWMLRTFAFRDDERHFTDLISFSKKRAAEEIGRRLVERGLLDGEEYYFLSKEELFDLLEGKAHVRLAKVKAAARRKNWERVNKDFDPPMYIVNGRYVDLDETTTPPDQAEDGVLRGTATSRGQVVGTARIVPTQADIARVRKGDIMITSATDPGWTPVFMAISGLVLETGGMLAHGACISREYGIPAIQIAGAMRLIEDGATISVNGDTGTVQVLAGPEIETADS